MCKKIFLLFFITPTFFFFSFFILKVCILLYFAIQVCACVTYFIFTLKVFLQLNIYFLSFVLKVATNVFFSLCFNFSSFPLFFASILNYSELLILGFILGFKNGFQTTLSLCFHLVCHPSSHLVTHLFSTRVLLYYFFF